MHSKSVIHNDLCTRNILLTSSMDIKICDFGFSTLIGEEILGGCEFKCNRGVSSVGSCILDDLFALSLLFYDILTGKKPYWDLEEDERI